MSLWLCVHMILLTFFVSESRPGGRRPDHHSRAGKGHRLLQALHDPRHQHHVPRPPGELAPTYTLLPQILKLFGHTTAGCQAWSNGWKRAALTFWPVSLSLSKSLHKLSSWPPYRLLHHSAAPFPPYLCFFKAIPSSSFSPPLTASLHDILSLLLPATFSQCPVPFTSPVFAHFLLLLLRPPILPAPDGSFYCVNFLMYVAVSQLFSACPRNGFGNLIHTSSALRGPQRAGPSKKQRNDSSAGGNEPVFAESVAH